MKRVETLIIGGFLLLLAAVGVYHLATSGMGNMKAVDGRTLTFVLPSTTGIALGQAVVSGAGTSGELLGHVVGIEPVSGGALISVHVEAGAVIHRGARAILRPAAPPRPSLVEISSSLASSEPLALPAHIPGSIELGAPEGMVEPTPVWPSEL